MGPLTVFLWVALTGGRPQPAEVGWAASVPLWRGLSPTGEVIDAGPAPAWASPPPAARLGTLPSLPHISTTVPHPRELPIGFAAEVRARPAAATGRASTESQFAVDQLVDLVPAARLAAPRR